MFSEFCYYGFLDGGVTHVLCNILRCIERTVLITVNFLEDIAQNRGGNEPVGIALTLVTGAKVEFIKEVE